MKTLFQWLFSALCTFFFCFINKSFTGLEPIILYFIILDYTERTLKEC